MPAEMAGQHRGDVVTAMASALHAVLFHFKLNTSP
jgi:hypothetical protein